MSIEIISTLAPKNAAPFPTHESQFGKGGWHAVSNYSDLALIPVLRREAGMAANVVSENKTYVLGTDLVTWIEFAGGGGGIPDAPYDGQGYVRSDGEWKQLNLFLDEGLYG